MPPGGVLGAVTREFDDEAEGGGMRDEDDVVGGPAGGDVACGGFS